ncbi:MAG TPA: prepilin-type N-terminal cleavage/methylation domain-containing protein [Verrucomicrobiales bacterium]|nr:prepilin-type N-terminal cleavage/methylation domain-containing protein [Verrucomicrobiales bacterium]
MKLRINEDSGLIKKGFTLIELLTVVSVISVLSSLMLTGIFAAKSKTRTVVCANSLKQLVHSWQMYTDDHAGSLAESFFFRDGRIPGKVNKHAWVLGSMNSQEGLFPQLNRTVPDAINPNGIRQGTLFPYNRSAGIYRCSADKSRTQERRRVRSYTMNGWIGGYPVAGQDHYRIMKKQSDLIHPPPSQLWVMIDEDHDSIDDGWFGVDMIGKVGLIDMPTDRHSNGFNLNFADGHVERWRLEDERSRNWDTLPVSNRPTNPDWTRLKTSTTGLKDEYRHQGY